jgi:hypothetical protein
MMIDSTAAKIGRSMKNFEKFMAFSRAWRSKTRQNVDAWGL